MISTAVVAHSARKAQAFDLAIQLDASVAYDLGEHGPGTNHRRAWELANTSAADWVLVVEDDAVLCTDFRKQLEKLLPTTPTPVVSLYAGTNYPYIKCDMAAHAAAQAEAQGTPWFTMRDMHHAVAICIRQHLVASMLDHTHHSHMPIDEAIGAWAQAHDIKVSYTHPQLVDHADGATITAHPDGITRTRPRKALKFAG